MIDNEKVCRFYYCTGDRAHLCRNPRNEKKIGCKFAGKIEWQDHCMFYNDRS